MFHVSRFFKAFHHPFHPPIEGEFPLMPLSLRFWRDAVHQYHLRRMSHSPFVGDIVIPSKNEMEEIDFSENLGNHIPSTCSSSSDH